MKNMSKNPKPVLPVAVFNAPTWPVGSPFSPEAPKTGIKSVLRAVWRLRTMDGLAPGSRFEWMEVSDA
jgi:hypothetical protein